MNEKDNFALVPRSPGALEKAEPGARRILSNMVADTFALAKKESPPKQRPLRIVSVDDEEGRLKVVEMTISRYFRGVTVQSFQDAEEAWQELSRADPDLLITDDIMGLLNGDEIVRRLADRKVAYPIIVINGYGPERDQWVLDFVKRGVDVTLLRAPYDLESLARALESGLRIQRDTAGAVEVAPQPSRIRPLRIVVLDNEELCRESYRVMLQSWYEGVVVVQCHTGDAAWEELSHTDPDLFTTDWNHATMRCDEMLQLLAARKVKYPVFVISAHDTMIQREAIKECADQGLNVSYLSKPWTIEQLRALLLKHLGPGDNLAGNRHSA